MRWDNLARAGAVLAVVALVVAWPRLRSPAPVVPAGGATPVRAAPAAGPDAGLRLGGDERDRGRGGRRRARGGPVARTVRARAPAAGQAVARGRRAVTRGPAAGGVRERPPAAVRSEPCGGVMRSGVLQSDAMRGHA